MLITVQLLVALTLLLTMSMLMVAGDEVLISGLHRDSVRAMDLGLAGLREAMTRMETGHHFTPGFTGSLAAALAGSALDVQVVRRFAGVNAAYQEVRVEAQVGRAVRRVSALVLHRSIAYPPNVISAHSLVQEGDSDLACGDIYARTFIRYDRLPSNRCGGPSTLSYAGWRISKTGEFTTACYSHDGCLATHTEGERWFPAHRRAEPSTSALGMDLAAQTTRCDAGGGGSLPADMITGVAASDPCDPSCTTETVGVYGFDIDDPDGAGSTPPQAVIPGVLPCGLPYRWEAVQFEDERGRQVTRLMKHISLDQWFAAYWRFDERALTYMKRSGNPCTDAYCLADGVEPDLVRYAQFSAVLPFPEGDIARNFDCRKTGGGTISTASLVCDEPAGVWSEFGCYSAAMPCIPAVDRTALLVLDGGDYRLDGVFAGHGTLVVEGNLTVDGGVSYWGTMVVNGSLVFNADGAVIHGGVMSKGILRIAGRVRVEGGGLIASVPIGPSAVTTRGWWER